MPSVAVVHKLGTSFASHDPSFGGIVFTLHIATCDAFSGTVQHPQPRGWTEVHAAAFTDKIGQHVTPAKS
jgi:hypothetical protein